MDVIHFKQEDREKQKFGIEVSERQDAKAQENIFSPVLKCPCVLLIELHLGECNASGSEQVKFRKKSFQIILFTKSLRTSLRTLCFHYELQNDNALYL
jgi:hypothetical protein